MSFNILIRTTCLPGPNARTPIAQMKIPCQRVQKKRAKIDVPIDVARIAIRIGGHELANAGGSIGRIVSCKVDRFTPVPNDTTVLKMTSRTIPKVDDFGAESSHDAIPE
jgi:hypothetical protein